ncbi:SIR2 family NAD-dependent protein deacylase [Stackebrandtia nassauensis]|uniref:protein acetyllysine N-acetyltransferase n=1 Tax=Stackebrandtia nassauensis (strain DSM 44728 / CIP 108903 / NRRL B-16338 / NBRC 102104 / LLR-40K-21) TaxID=446470 RepID=D3Q6B8_STANL|nr:Sir2 family NAD-dependent protein deacetylase [Stackebrandtia nassauensis]ADD42293.1 Silent information regulator protein Sir2 [Stackebrandtia nassauensis DSM 44728]
MDVNRVRDWIDAADTVTVLTGAGVSTESGIPDYRGPNGAWTKDPDSAKYVDIDYYVRDPAIRRRAWIRRREHEAWTVEPNPAHHALVTLEARGKLTKLITQNIDGLHQKAGQTPTNVLEIHGNIFGVECLGCDATTTMRATLDRVAAGEDDPACLSCGGILKSSTIFFGQQLKTDVLYAAAESAQSCDLFLSVGTSLTVHPAAGLVDIALQSGARLVICNAEPTPYDHRADAVLTDPIGQTLPAILNN